MLPSMSAQCGQTKATSHSASPTHTPPNLPHSYITHVIYPILTLHLTQTYIHTYPPCTIVSNIQTTIRTPRGSYDYIYPLECPTLTLTWHIPARHIQALHVIYHPSSPVRTKVRWGHMLVRIKIRLPLECIDRVYWQGVLTRVYWQGILTRCVDTWWRELLNPQSSQCSSFDHQRCAFGY